MFLLIRLSEILLFTLKVLFLLLFLCGISWTALGSRLWVRVWTWFLALGIRVLGFGFSVLSSPGSWLFYFVHDRSTHPSRFHGDCLTD